MNLSAEQLLEIAQYSFIRMDGAWFMAIARKLGKKTTSGFTGPFFPL